MKNYNRPKKKDKGRKTFEKYGKYTQKSIRIMEEMKRNKVESIPPQDNKPSKKKNNATDNGVEGK